MSSPFAVEVARLQKHLQKREDDQQDVEYAAHAQVQREKRKKHVNLKSRFLDAAPRKREEAIPVVELCALVGVQKTKPVMRVVRWLCRNGLMRMENKTKSAVYWVKAA